MCSVAEKIAKKLVSSREPTVAEVANWREGRNMALEAGLGDEGPPRISRASSRFNILDAVAAMSDSRKPYGSCLYLCNGQC